MTTQTIIISRGSHHKMTSLPPFDGEERRFAHIWDFEDVEDNAHQVSNFVKYATALGGFSSPVVLISPPAPADPRDWDYIQVKMADWALAVEESLGVEVEIR
jgi:hypothetical protein